VSDKCVEFGKTAVVEQAHKALSCCELAALMLRFDSFFAATKMSGFSPGRKLVQLRLLYLIFRTV
jgi:hypothetical protein